MRTLLVIFALWVGPVHAQSRIDIACDTLTGDDYRIKLSYRGLDPRDNIGAPVDVTLNGRKLRSSLFQSAVEPAGQRAYLEIVLDELATPETDRVVSLMATWMGERGEVVWGRGILVDSLYRHREGKVREGPELKVQCLLEGLPVR
ncbi:MAG: hypothetical protein KF767_15690 [Bdellovibrionaceae bacterium]|nr:hypothetical protein [Pseudobdellovibrionaceae bacterium]